MSPLTRTLAAREREQVRAHRRHARACHEGRRATGWGLGVGLGLCVMGLGVAQLIRWIWPR